MSEALRDQYWFSVGHHQMAADSLTSLPVYLMRNYTPQLFYPCRTDKSVAWDAVSSVTLWCVVVDKIMINVGHTLACRWAERTVTHDAEPRKHTHRESHALGSVGASQVRGKRQFKQEGCDQTCRDGGGERQEDKVLFQQP